MTETQAAEIAMSKKWYIVHTYSGYEAKAKQALLERAKARWEGGASSTRS